MHYRLKHYRLQTRRAFRRFERRYRNHKNTLPAVVGVSVMCLSLVLVLTLRDSNIVTQSRLDGTNIVLLHADKETRVLPTREKTVAGLLQNAGITVNEGDVVEPAMDASIEEDDFRINVYRAAPVVIQDDDTRILTMSAAQTSRSIADQAGISVHPEDKITTEPSRDFLRDGIGSKVVIQRSTPVVMNLYGASLPLRTHAQTVGDLLDEKQIHIEEGDTVQPSRETVLAENMQIFVTRFGVQVVMVEESIPMPVETIEDNSLSYGSIAVRQNGAEGKKSVTYQLQLENGVEVGREIIQEIIVQEPIKQIVARGTSGKFENFTAEGIPARVFCASPRQGNWKNINTHNAALGRAMAEAKGWTGAQFNALLELWACESSWNERAGNPISGAYGIPQSWPAEKMADNGSCGGAGYLTDPQIQMSWGLCYIQRRHGSPIEALNFHHRNNWY